MMTESTRLHITPLMRDLLSSVLPASIQSSAADVSFHTVPTFPENSYGYVTLPTAEAEKFRKKMDGSILKGKKFRVEVARPQKRPMDEAMDDESDPRPVSGKSSKRQKKEEDGVLDGYELKDRQVKRGWTESTDAKKERRTAEKRKRKEEKKTKEQPKSKYTDKAECLFRTRVPPNRSSAADADGKQPKKKKSHSKESVVHEFSNTVAYPTFVRSGAGGAPPSSTFEEGKGWVDDSGNLKEPVSDRIRSDQYKPGQVPGAKEKRKLAKTAPVEQNSQSEAPKEKGESVPEPESESEDWTSSSGATSSDESSSESDESTPSSSDESVSGSNDESQKSSSSPKAIQPTDSTGAGKECGKQASLDTAGEQPSADVHPLEALYKRPAPDSTENEPSSEANNHFSFFGSNDIESEDEDGKSEGPYTPYTKKDIEERGLRSAAPTPDTALPGRRMQWNESESEDNGPYNSTPIPKSGSAAKSEESDFAKWFWENRGDNNRAWKKRRRDAAKEERQRENRRKGMKGKS